MPIQLDLPTAWKRAPYIRELVFIGPDWRGETMRLEIRNREGDQGVPLIALDNVTSGQGIAVTYDPAFPVPNSDDTAGASILRIRINETTLENLPYNTPYEAEYDFRYDLHIGTGSAKQVVTYGAFPLRPGVTL